MIISHEQGDRGILEIDKGGIDSRRATVIELVESWRGGIESDDCAPMPALQILRRSDGTISHAR